MALSSEELKKIRYVSMKAHSTYSMPQSVCQVKDHFSKFQKLFTGACITDVNHYASFYDLMKLTKKTGFPSLYGADLTVYDLSLIHI